MTIPITQSAYRHGIVANDMLHALEHAQREYDMDDEMSLIIGPSGTGALLEIGVSRRSGEWRIVHAMRAREKFTR